VARRILDGVPGLIISMDDAFGTFLKYAKLWELQHVSPALTEADRELQPDPAPQATRAAS